MSTHNPEYIFAPAEADGSDGLLAIVIRKIADQVKGPSEVEFFTTKDCSQQVGFIRHPKGHVIPAHTHNASSPRIIRDIPETLMVMAGRLLVEFYTSSRLKVCGRVLEQGDVVVLLCGGHGFECMEDTEIYEVRQGPYLAVRDKVQFEPPRATQLSYGGEVNDDLLSGITNIEAVKGAEDITATAHFDPEPPEGTEQLWEKE